MRCKKIHSGLEFRLMKKKKGAHLKRPQIHFGSVWDMPSGYRSLSDTHVIELRDWLSRYIDEYVNETPHGEIIKASRVHANRIRQNMDKLAGKRI